MRRCSRGQSLVETLVALTALVPLLMGMAWLSRLIDQQQLTILAVREAAFDCVWRPESCGAQSTRIPSSLGPVLVSRVVPWTTPDGHRGASVPPEIHVQHQPIRFNTPLAFAGGSARQVIPQAVSVLSDLAGPGRFGLDLETGLFRTEVSVRPVSGPEFPALRLFSSGAARHEARLALLTDDWMARGPEGESSDTVRSRVERGQQVPGVEMLLRAGAWPVRGLLQIADWVGLESAAGQFQPHHIDVDRVPPDRLGVGRWPMPEPVPEPISPPESGAGSSDGA